MYLSDTGSSPEWAIPVLFFIFVSSMLQLSSSVYSYMFSKNYLWLDSNMGPHVLEAVTLSTGAKAIQYYNKQM